MIRIIRVGTVRADCVRFQSVSEWTHIISTHCFFCLALPPVECSTYCTAFFTNNNNNIPHPQLNHLISARVFFNRSYPSTTVLISESNLPHRVSFRFESESSSYCNTQYRLRSGSRQFNSIDRTILLVLLSSTIEQQNTAHSQSAHCRRAF